MTAKKPSRPIEILFNSLNSILDFQGGNMLQFNLKSIDSTSESILTLVEDLKSAMSLARQRLINGSFSAVSGLDQLGRGHGLILDGGSGSAASALESLGELVSWCQQTLNLHTAALTTQDMAHRVGLITQTPNESDVFTAPGRPSGRFDGLDPINAVVGAAVSVDQLAGFLPPPASTRSSRPNRRGCL